MILNALVERLQRRSKHDFKGRHFEAALILQALELWRNVGDDGVREATYRGGLRWLGLSGQRFRFAKWSVCRG
jgi:hypothetical protein